jgi:hypothetical protein
MVNSIVDKLAHSLQADDGESPLELLPNLKELGYYGDDARGAFTPFIDEQQVEGHTVSLNLTMANTSVFRR